MIHKSLAGVFLITINRIKSLSQMPNPYATQIFLNMALDSSAKSCGPTRCIIYCSMSKFNKHSQDVYGIVFVKEVVEYASGDYQKACLLGTITGNHAFIVFDYNNPDHHSDCRVLGFRIKRSIRLISVPAKLVHSTVDRWKQENEQWHLSFPRKGQLIPASKQNITSPSSAPASNSKTSEDNTANKNKDSEDT